MSGGLQLPRGQMRPPLAVRSRWRVGGPNTGRPSVSGSCTQEGELTGDKPTHLFILLLILIREDREGRMGSPLEISLLLTVCGAGRTYL